MRFGRRFGCADGLMGPLGTDKIRFYLLALVLAGALILSACGGGGDDAAEDDGDTADQEAGQQAEEDGKKGSVPANQPDVNQDGQVVIGVLSPGDTNDNGYYESFVTTAQQFAEENGWELLIVDKINPADAVAQARAMCRQRVDMVAVAASELKDAIPVAEEPECEGSVWYVAGGAGVEQTPYFVQTTDDVFESQFAAGYASGLVMDQQGATKAGFVTGPELDFSIQAFQAFEAGIKEVVPNAKVVATYTGDFDDSALGREAAQAQLSQGVELLYPYLGGATDAVASLGAENGVPSVTPGTDRCSDDRFAISSLFSPGELFAGSLQDFAEGDLRIGVTKQFRIGKDPVPSAKICPHVENADDLQAKLDDLMERIGSGEIDPRAKAGVEE
jgi:basic membrane protein A and related proteins